MEREKIININKRLGFTLMEIMIVIIVISVLASIAGPLIANITDMSRSSGTKSKMDTLKTALFKYRNDIGCFPSARADETDIQGFRQDKVLSTISEEYNVLISDSDTETKRIKDYKKKWKGPYIDSDISDFMNDSWNNTIWYIRYNKSLYLWSSGPDGEFYTDPKGEYNPDFAFLKQNDEDCDDIIISVTKYKKAVPQKETSSLTPSAILGNLKGKDSNPSNFNNTIGNSIGNFTSNINNN